MTKQQKIMLGILGVGAIAYYIWKKNKDKQLATQIEKMTEINEKFGNKNNSIGLGEGSQNKGVAMQTQPIVMGDYSRGTLA